jgi:predicted CXXCH cytochrome family protein
VNDEASVHGEKSRRLSGRKKTARKRTKTERIRDLAQPSQRSRPPHKPHRVVRFLPWLLPIVLVSSGFLALRIRWAYKSVRPVIASKRSLALDAEFVGSAACATCHAHENSLWRGSHHQLAMQPATNSTVLGNFNNTSFNNGGIISTFFRRGSKFMVHTDGPDGTLYDYEIEDTFGLYPLQQYLIALPGGRLQALGIAWDSRPRQIGGQRWFFLYPNQKIPPSDSLHWTGIDQTWNYMCADCHSTNLRKNYDLQTRTYSTTYAEINVACEACHGPGSGHIAWAKRQGDWAKLSATAGLTIALPKRNDATWAIDPATGEPRSATPRTSEREIQMCARCHSRRGQIHEDYVHGQPVGDDYRVALLDKDLYFPDGQIKGEVYEYGSFIQSRMFREGVTCSDCHEPHSLKLRAEGNRVCLQCHSAKYDSPAHHFHKLGSVGAQCANCHMPTRTYMVVDARRDHSIRIPRPDLSIKLGTPNACNNCHTDKSAQWASDTVYKWYGHAPSGFQQFAETLHNGAEGAPDAQQALKVLVANRGQPPIARASALSLLAAFAPSSTDASVNTGARDDSPLVRRAAARALSSSDRGSSARILTLLLSDSVRSVRIEAADMMAGTLPNTLSPVVSSQLDKAITEYIASQELSADRPESHMNLALLHAKLNEFAQAERELKVALSLDSTFAPAAVNLADLYREQDRDTEGERVLQDAIGRLPNDASLQYSLGLLMVREKRRTEALDLLGVAARLEPANARYAYVYAIALNDAGSTSAAIDVLEASITVNPYDRDTLAALVSWLDSAGDHAKALVYAQRLKQLDGSRQQ